jgi:hypothetical protein
VAVISERLNITVRFQSPCGEDGLKGYLWKRLWGASRIGLIDAGRFWPAKTVFLCEKTQESMIETRSRSGIDACQRLHMVFKDRGTCEGSLALNPLRLT